MNAIFLEELKEIANKIFSTMAKWNKKGDISITEGEPLVKRIVPAPYISERFR